MDAFSVIRGFRAHHSSLFRLIAQGLTGVLGKGQGLLPGSKDASPPPRCATLNLLTRLLTRRVRVSGDDDIVPESQVQGLRFREAEPADFGDFRFLGNQ